MASPESDKSPEQEDNRSEVEKFVDFIVEDQKRMQEVDVSLILPDDDDVDDEFEILKEELIDRMQKRVESAIDGKIGVTYGAYRWDEQGLPIDNLDEIAIHGPTRSEDEIWDSYIGDVIENPTWLQLAVEANRMIVASNDYHHVAFEDIEVRYETEDGVKVLSLALGS